MIYNYVLGLINDQHTILEQKFLQRNLNSDKKTACVLEVLSRDHVATVSFPPSAYTCHDRSSILVRTTTDAKVIY